MLEKGFQLVQNVNNLKLPLKAKGLRLFGYTREGRSRSELTKLIVNLGAQLSPEQLPKEII